MRPVQADASELLQWWSCDDPGIFPVIENACSVIRVKAWYFSPWCFYVHFGSSVVCAGGDRKDLKYIECPTLVTWGLSFPDLANKNIDAH